MIVGGSVEEVEAIGGDTALLVAIILAVFTILFGTRRGWMAGKDTGG